MPRTHPSQCKQPLTELLSPNTLFFFLCFSSPLLTPSGARGTCAGSPRSCWSQIP